MASRPDPQPRSPGKAAQAALALAQGKSMREAAQAVGVNEKTVRRWARGAKFRARVEALRAELTDQTLNRLAVCSSAAVAELARLMTSSANDSVRLGAARAILDKFPIMSEYFQLAERVRRLEQQGPPARGREQWG